MVSKKKHADGTTSLYFIVGGGVIGAGAHDTVRRAFRTFDGTLSAEAPVEDLGYGRHPLSPVFLAGHGVITAIRLLEESKKL